jgi:hypothetical protein
MSNWVGLNPHGVVILRGIPVALTTDLGRAFTADRARSAEKLISDDDLRTKYGLSNNPTIAWVESEVDDYIAERMQARQAPEVALSADVEPALNTA